MGLNLAQRIYKYLRFRNMTKLVQGIPVVNFFLMRPFAITQPR